MVAPVQPVQYEWKESPIHAQDDSYYRWLFNRDDYGFRQPRQTEFVYPNGGQTFGYPSGFKYPSLEQERETEGDSIPITIVFKGPSTAFNMQHLTNGDGQVRNLYDDASQHMIHRVTKPVITEIHEIITPFRKSTTEIAPLREDVRVPQYIPAAPVNAKYLNRYPESFSRNYSLLKDKNAHNFGAFNKLYDLGLQMNKANGYVLSPSHPTSQGHVEEVIDEPESEASNEESSKSQPV